MSIHLITETIGIKLCFNIDAIPCVKDKKNQCYLLKYSKVDFIQDHCYTFGGHGNDILQ